MEEGDILFDLVKRLDENENRFVVQFANCGRKAPQKALMLLKLMREMSHYDKRVLNAKVANLNIERFHLRQLIMHALRAKRDSERADGEIHAHIEDYHIFYDKGFYDEAFRTLNKAEKLAETHQNLGRLIEVLNLQKRRILELETRDLPELIAERNDLLQMAVTRFVHEMEMANQYHLAFAKYRTKEDIESSPTQKIPDELLDDATTSFNARLYGLTKGSLEARRRVNLPLAKQYLERIIALWEAFPEIMKDQAAKYKIALANYAVYLFPEANYHRVRETIEKIAALPDRNFNEEAETFQNIANLRLLLQLNDSIKKDFEPLVDYIEKGFEKYASKINPARQFSLWYNLMLLYFIHCDYRQARVWIERILEHTRFNIRREIQYITRLVELVIFYELQIWDTPDSNVMATYRYFSRKEELTDFKRDILALFTKLSATPINERKKEFQNLHDKLRSSEPTETAADALGLKVVTAWVRSKINGTAIVENLKDF